MTNVMHQPAVDPQDVRQNLSGHLRLVCGVNSAGRSSLAEQSFSTPFHISKPHWDDGLLTVMVVNPTAGLFEGDRLSSSVEVRKGARLRLTSPSASRPHRMTAGEAICEQGFVVGAGAFLDYLPAPLIPHRGSRYIQKTRVEVDAAGELFFLEWVTPGRVARGEVFDFDGLRWDSELRWAGRLVAKEQFQLDPRNGSLASFKRLFPEGHFASGYVVASALVEGHPAIASVRELNGPDLRVGISRLVAGGWSLRLLARDSLSMRGGIARLRQCLEPSIPDLAQPFRMT